MKIAFCINQDIYAYIFLSELIKHVDITGCTVLYTQGVGQLNPYVQYLRTFEQTFPHVYSQLASQPVYFDKLVKTHGLELINVTHLNPTQLLGTLQAAKPLGIISVRFGKIFKGAMLTVAPLGILNIHSGLLPHYRGILGTFWALKQRQPEYGVTLHTIADASIDTGAIIAEQRFAAAQATCLLSAIAQLYPIAAQLTAQALQTWQTGQPLLGVPQPTDTGAYYSTPLPQDFEAFPLPLVNTNAYTQWLAQYLAP
jgi:methionyl-tRNA formyltransferase